MGFIFGNFIRIKGSELKLLINYIDDAVKIYRNEFVENKILMKMTLFVLRVNE